MAEVCVERAVQREGGRVRIKCRVGGRAVVDRRVGQAGQKFVDVADALCWAKRSLAPSTLYQCFLSRQTTTAESCSPSLVVFVDIAVIFEVGKDVE